MYLSGAIRRATAFTAVAASPLVGQVAGVERGSTPTVPPGVVMVRALEPAGTLFSPVAGFVADDGRVVTSVEVLRRASSVQILTHPGEILRDSIVSDSVIGTSELAILPALLDPPARLRLAATAPAIGDSVRIFTAASRLVTVEGVVNGFRQYGDRTFLQVSASIPGAATSGPVTNLHGEVVGFAIRVLPTAANVIVAVSARDIALALGSPAYSVELSSPGVSPAAAAARQQDAAPAEASSGTSTSSTMAGAAQLPVLEERLVSKSEVRMGFLGCFTSRNVEPHAVCVVRATDLRPKGRGQIVIRDIRLIDGTGISRRPNHAFSHTGHAGSRASTYSWSLTASEELLIFFMFGGVPPVAGGRLEMSVGFKGGSPMTAVAFPEALRINP